MATANVKSVFDQKITKAYFYAVGRRKTAIATVRLFEDKSNQMIVNGQDLRDYFLNQTLISEVLKPFVELAIRGGVSITARIIGGGKTAQAQALQLAIARALVLRSQDNRGTLKKANLLSRDAREKESKKYGLKKARKAPQFSKR